MGNKIRNKVVKLAFFGGLVVAFISLFVDWYTYEVWAAEGLIAQWSFQLLTGWHTSFIEGIGSNETLRPSNSTEPFIMSILLIGMIITCGYGTLLKDVEITNSIEKSTPYIYLNVFLVLLLGYFIAILPCTFLFTRELYVPFMIVEDLQENTTSFYCIGLAYLMQGSAFIMIIPQVIISVITMNTFRCDQEDSESIIRQKLEESKEEIAIDKFIAELNAEVYQKTNNDADIMYEQFQQQRRRKKYR